MRSKISAFEKNKGYLGINQLQEYGGEHELTVCFGNWQLCEFAYAIRDGEMDDDVFLSKR